MIIQRRANVPMPRPLLRYPFDLLEIGDSLWVRGDEGRAMFSAARQYAARHPPWRCTGRKQERGWRVWRIG
jgi:hypothetical protein